MCEGGWRQYTRSQMKLLLYAIKKEIDFNLGAFFVKLVDGPTQGPWMTLNVLWYEKTQPSSDRAHPEDSDQTYASAVLGWIMFIYSLTRLRSA